MSRTDSLMKYDKLIADGRHLLPFDYGLEYLARKDAWQASCQLLLERTHGKESIFIKSFQKILGYLNQEAHVTSGLALMEKAREELESETKSEKLGIIEKKIRKEKVEAERRAAVVETKLWGSVIELIDMQREELKRRSELNHELVEIRKELGELKSMLRELDDKLKQLT